MDNLEFFDDIQRQDFQRLIAQAGWEYLDKGVIEKALQNSNFKVSAFLNNKCVGMARIVGDGISHGLLCDVVVDDKVRNRGIGTEMIKHLTERVQDYVNTYCDEFMVELMPTAGLEKFYGNCGFKGKFEVFVGMYKWFKNQNAYSNDSRKYYLRLNEEPYKKILSQEKTIEMRLWDEKRQKLKVGDYIIFVNRNDDSQMMKTKVLGLYRFKNFDQLYNYFDKTQLGYGQNEEANPQDMSKYYDSEDIKKYGVVGIEIKLVD